ncbi:MAG: polysaccharide deacetylase family protein [Gemmatimonadales bacterium]
MSALRLVKRAAYGAAWRSGTIAALRWLHRDRIPILCYHSILPDQAAMPPWLTAWDGGGGLHLPAEQFREQLEFLARRYRVVPLLDIVAALAEGRRLPARCVALTFDDGYANNLSVAAPLLAEYGLPATIFLATDYIGRGGFFWWDDLRARLWTRKELATGRVAGRAALLQGAELLRAATLDERRHLLDAWGRAGEGGERDARRDDAVRPATWEECRAAPPNIQFGGHGASHRLLGAIDLETARQDLHDCRRALTRELGGSAVPLFCYPAGQWTAPVRAALPGAGFRAAVIAGPHRSDQRLASQADALTLLPRVGVTGGMSLAAFAGRLAGLNGLFGS